MSEIISRKEARTLGLKRYFTGKPCLRGHLSERKTISGGCSECDRQANRLCQRKYPVRHRKLSSEQRALKAEKARQRRLENPEKYREQSKRWREARDPDARRQQDARYYQQYYEKVRQKVNNRRRKHAMALEIVKRLGIQL